MMMIFVRLLHQYFVFLLIIPHLGIPFYRSNNIWEYHFIGQITSEQYHFIGQITSEQYHFIGQLTSEQYHFIGQITSERQRYPDVAFIDESKDYHSTTG